MKATKKLIVNGTKFLKQFNALRDFQKSVDCSVETIIIFHYIKNGQSGYKRFSIKLEMIMM